MTCEILRDEPDARVARRRKKSSGWIAKAVGYWSERIDELDIGCDWSEADVRCWRCGCLRSCQKCHIVAKGLGGSDDVWNLIPLCAHCHDEMPNVSDPLEVWRWIAADHGELYDTYWTRRALEEAALSEEQLCRFERDRLREALKCCNPHFGQNNGGIRTTPSTLAWAIRKACSTDDTATQ